VDISFTVCLCVCTVTDFSAKDKPSGVKNFARRFIGVQGRESYILGNFAPPEAQNGTNRAARHHLHDVHNDYPLAPEHMIMRRVDVGLACVDICPSWKKDILVKFVA